MKKVNFRILNKKGFVIDEFERNLPEEYLLQLNINENYHYFNGEGRLYNQAPITYAFCVKYTNPNIFKGEALYYFTLATDDHDAKRKAMRCDEFREKIFTSNFNKNNLIATIPLLKTFDMSKLNTVEYFDEDPLL